MGRMYYANFHINVSICLEKTIKGKVPEPKNAKESHSSCRESSIGRPTHSQLVYWLIASGFLEKTVTLQNEQVISTYSWLVPISRLINVHCLKGVILSLKVLRRRHIYNFR
jgi:hypothetical protein